MSGEGNASKVGTVLDGRYRLDEVLGAGTMGTVYLATQLTVHRKVAVKILNASVKHHPKLQQRFEIEARAVASLNHPNVLTLFDFAYSMSGDVLYMVVEYIEGDTLSALIARGISPKLATHVAYQAANALAHAHAAGVAHRDLKPGNIMLSRERRGERVKVLDFGLARIHQEEQATGEKKRRLTQIGDVHGSPAYMSPEQCLGDLETGSPADIYSLGCVMYEMFEGELPFEYQSAGKLMQGHMYEDPPEVQNTAIAEDVRELVQHMLRKVPSERPSAEQVMEVLEPYIELDVSMETRVPPLDEGPLVAPEEAPPVEREPDPSAELLSHARPDTPARGTPWVGVVLVLATLIALLVAALMLT